MRGKIVGSVTAAAVALMLAFPNPGAAASNFWDLICGGDTSFSLCASVNVTFNYGGGTSGTISMTVWNLSDSPLNPSAGEEGVENTALTKIGLFNTVSPGVFTPYTVGATATSGWATGTHPGLGSSGGQQLEFGVNTNGVGDAIRTQTFAGSGNNWLFFTFGISGAATDLAAFASNLDAGNVGLSIHGQSGVPLVPGGDGNSTTCLTTGDNANCTPIPEPTTLLLLGTGLAGIAVIRRRRGNGIETEEV